MIKRLSHLLVAIAAAVLVVSCIRDAKDYTIRIDVPQRPAGQTDVLGLTAPAIPDVGIGVVGLGMRGSDAVERLSFVPGCHVAAVCDLQADRVEESLGYLSAKGIQAKGYGGEEESYKRLCEDPSVDLVYVCTDWLHHVPVALYAMEHGKHVAVEVPAATSLEDIWKLIDTSERTRLHCMMLENCCYDFFELGALAMAQSGLIGEIIHVEGAYLHNLDPFWNEYWNDWRLSFNKDHRGDVYPTHGLGPICQALDIHRGDRMRTLVAMDTRSFNGKMHASTRKTMTGDFLGGDETSTLIRTDKGKTILVEHDVMTPRPYSRMYQLVGTDGFVGKYPVRQVCLRNEGAGNVDYENLQGEKIYSGEALEELMEKYPSPILTPGLVTLAQEVGGHGGMDFIMDYRLVYCLNNGLPLDMDVYDLAEWCCLGPLGSISIENGSAPVEVPDFTRGGQDKIKGFSYAFAETKK